MLMPNCSFLFFNNQNVIDQFRKNHEYISGIDYGEDTPYWLFLFAEQNLLGYIMRDLKVNNTTIDDRISIQFPEISDEIGFTPEWVYSEHYKNNIKIEYEHVWMKKFLFGNNKYTKDKVNEWNKIIIDNGYEKKLKKIT
jgi:hypothetical protein